MSGNDYTRSVKQLQKKYKYEFTEEFIEKMKEEFIFHAGLPSDMGADIVDRIVGDSDDLSEKINYKLADMVDLFHETYDVQSGSIEAEDWVFIKDLVNNWALELDMDMVTYVMQQVIDAGVFE